MGVEKQTILRNVFHRETTLTNLCCSSTNDLRHKYFLSSSTSRVKNVTQKRRRGGEGVTLMHSIYFRISLKRDEKEEKTVWLESDKMTKTFVRHIPEND